MEACLAAMEGAQQQGGDEQTPSNIMSNNGVAYSSVSAKPRAHDNVWKRAMKEWVMNGKCAEGLRLPNPQAEVSRHFQTQQLSSFLLKQCPSLRMPAFERWWIDSKWEEYDSVFTILLQMMIQSCRVGRRPNPRLRID